MRNKVLVPAMPHWRGNSPGNRKALSVKMNNFVGDDSVISKADPSMGTWPLKEDKRKRRKVRPLTATLERPRLLDISLLGKIDMSLMRKELLSIYTLMRAPIVVKQQVKQNKRPKALSDDTENDENTSPKSVKPKCKSKRSSKHDSIQSIMIDTCSHGLKKDSQKSSTKSLTSREKSPLKLRPTVSRHYLNLGRKKVDEVFIGPVIKPLAAPCDSCGRASHPERLHTHPPPPSPVTPLSTRNISLKPHNNIPLRSRSDELLNILREKEKSEQRQGSVRRRRSPLKKTVIMNNEPPPRSARNSRLEPEPVIAGVPILCSYCGRRFGTASIAIHEGKCRERKESNLNPENGQRITRASTSPGRRYSSPKKVEIKKPRAETAEVLMSPPKAPQITLTVPVVESPRTSESSRGAHDSAPSPRVRHSTLAVSNNRLKPQEIPEAEDYIFKQDGTLDCEATFHQIWANHLKSLIQCPRCGRRFAPDRIEKHRGVCTGSNKRPIQQK